MRAITIRPFRPEDQDAAKRLIVTGLREHWGFIDSSKNPDLDDIAASYAGVTFLVAREQGRIVGTGALVREAAGVGRIVRVSVDPGLRRRGIGRMIVRELVERAREEGYASIVLETTATWHDAVEFYRRCNFGISHTDGEDVHMRLDLV